MSRGGTRPNAGRRSVYAHPTEAFSLDFTQQGRVILNRTAEATGLSRSNVVSVLLDAHLDDPDIRFDEHYRFKLQCAFRAKLPADLAARFREQHERWGRSYSDIVEYLLREKASVTDFPTLPVSKRAQRLAIKRLSRDNRVDRLPDSVAQPQDEL